MTINIQENLRYYESRALSMVERVLANNPQLVEMAKSKDLKGVQLFLEENFSKEEKEHWVIRNLFESNEVLMNGFKAVCEPNELDQKLVMRLCAKMTLHRRCSVEALANEIQAWFESPKEISDFLEKAESLKFIQRIDGMYIVNKNTAMQLTKEQEEELDLIQSNPPMVCKPNKIFKAKNGLYRNGYLKIKKGVFTRKADPHDQVPLDFLRSQNYMKYRLDYLTWSLYLKDHPYIPGREPNEDDSSYDKKVKAALRHHFKLMFYMELYNRLGIEDIYILTMLDYRGRNYPICSLFNPQGTDWDKALFCVAPSEISTDGIRWLKISIANCCNVKFNGKDLDKNTYEDRIKWFDREMIPVMNQEYEEAVSSLNAMAEKAESSACFFKQALNMWFIHNVKEGGKPMCYCITHFDATASGYQLQAIFANDWEMARLTNLVPNSKRERVDLYTNLYDRLIARGLPNTYTRTEVKKKCFIPAVYNSINSIAELFVNEQHQEIFQEVMMEFAMWRMNRSFPKLWEDLWNLKVTEYSWDMPDGMMVYKKIRPKKRKDEQYCKDYVYVPWVINGIEIMFTHIPNKAIRYSLELGPNITHSCDGFVARELVRRLGFSQRKRKWIANLLNSPWTWTQEEDKQGSRAKMERILQCSQDCQFNSMAILTELTPANADLVPLDVAQELIESLPDVCCNISEIHDSFGVHPNYVSALVGQYKIILRDLAKSRFLQNTAESIMHTPKGSVPYEIDQEFVDAIMKGIYPLC